MRNVGWRPVLIVAAVAAVVHLAVALRFGWHRDELYYVTAGQHPALGYVDQPPLTPLLAALAGNLPVLRLLAIIAQVGCVVLTAVLAAELGGNRRAQVLAAGCVAASPVFLGASLLFGTTVLDQLVWIAVLLTTARALRIGTVRSWLVVGLIAGVGMENKDTVAVLLAGIGLGLLLCRREVLRTRGPWLAAGLALLIALPNIVWDFANGFPELEMAAVIAHKQGGVLGSVVQLVLLALLLAGPPLVAVWWFGARELWRGEHRWLLVVAIVAAVVFTLSGGKSYYTAPVLAGLFAAGCVWLGERAPSRGWPVAIVATGVVAALLTLPILPASVMTHLRAVDPEPVETYGWPEFVAQVAKAEQSMPPGTPIFTSNYGEAGALTLLGGFRDVYSGHNAYGDWGPPQGTSPTVLCVGEFTAADLQQGWKTVEPIAPITLPDGIQNEETANHATMFRCEQPRGSWAQMWPRIRRLD